MHTDYYTYKAEYDAAAADPVCQNVSNLANCPPLAKTSVFQTYDNRRVQLDAPMLDFRVYGTNESSGLPNTWICDGVTFNTVDFTNLGGSPYANITVICQAGSDYQWGFSFLLLFIVCVFQMLFAAIMYGLCIEARRNSLTTQYRIERVDPWNGHVHHAPKYYTSVMGHATNMVAQAEKAYGDDIKVWSTKKLDNTVWRGKRGMRAIQA